MNITAAEHKALFHPSWNNGSIYVYTLYCIYVLKVHLHFFQAVKLHQRT